MVRKLLAHLDEEGLKALIFAPDASGLTSDYRSTEALCGVLQAAEENNRRDQDLSLEGESLGEVLGQLMEDLPHNFQELIQLIKLKDVIEAKLRRKSASKRSRRTVALQKLESSFEANFSQREMLLFLAEKAMHSLVFLLCKQKVG